MSTHTRKPVRHAPAATETDASKVSYYASRSLAPAGASLYGAKAARTPHAPDDHAHSHDSHDAEMPPVPQNGRNAKSIDMVSRTPNHGSDKDKDSKPAVKDSHPQTEESLAKTTAHGEAKNGAATTQSAAHAAVLSSAGHEKAHH